MRACSLRSSLAVVSLGLAFSLALFPRATSAEGRPFVMLVPHSGSAHGAIASNQCLPGKKLYACVTITAAGSTYIEMIIGCGADCDYTEWFGSVAVKEHGLQPTTQVTQYVEQWVPGGVNDVYISTTRTKKSARNKYIVNVQGCNTESSPSFCTTFLIGVTVQASGG
jgi:hypothetical protein